MSFRWRKKRNIKKKKKLGHTIRKTSSWRKIKRVQGRHCEGR